MSKLAKRQIEALEPQSKDYFVWDSELSSFGIRIFPTGRKQFVVQSLWAYLATHEPWSVWSYYP